MGYFCSAVGQPVGQDLALLVTPMKFGIQSSLNVVSLVGDQTPIADGTKNTMSLYIQNNNNNVLYNNICQLSLGSGLLPEMVVSCGHITLDGVNQ